MASIKKNPLAVFVNSESAYDNVVTKHQTRKIINIGIGMLNWFITFLAQRFRYQYSISRYVQLRNGLPLGAITCYILLSIIINNLVERLQNIPGIRYLVFADDIVLETTYHFLTFSGREVKMRGFLNP